MMPHEIGGLTVIYMYLGQFSIDSNKKVFYGCYLACAVPHISRIKKMYLLTLKNECKQFDLIQKRLSSLNSPILPHSILSSF